MNVTVTFGGLANGDKDDLERILLGIRRAFHGEPAGTLAASRLLDALATYRNIGHRRPEDGIRVRLTTDLAPDEEEHVRAFLIASLQHARDQAWLSDRLRVWFNEVCCELIDDRSAAVKEADTIRRLMHSLPVSDNPVDAA